MRTATVGFDKTPTTIKTASELQAGDQFKVWVYGSNGQMGVLVTILNAPELFEDRFGRTMIKVWCIREDSGKQGRMEFGPSAEVYLV